MSETNPPEGDRSQIVPRIKHTNFISAFEEMEIPRDQFPIVEPFVADLIVTYAFDIDGAFRFLNREDLGRLNIGASELREIAMENLRKGHPGIGVQQQGPFLQVVTGNDLEACALLSARFWTTLSETLPGQLVVSVPSRDVVLIAVNPSHEVLAVLRQASSELHRDAVNHALTRRFLTWRDGSWDIYRGE